MYQAQLHGIKLAMNQQQRRSSRSLQEQPERKLERQQSNGSLAHNSIDIEVRVRNTKVVDWIVLIIPIIYTITIFVLTLLIYFHTPQLNYPHIAHNILIKTHLLQTRFPIIDLQILTEYQYHMFGCPSNYEQVNFGTWEGTHKGEVCDSNNQNCLQVDTNEPQTITIWKSQIYCLKYDKTAQWLTGQQCLKQYKQCSPYICVKQQYECPITDLKPISQQGNIHFGKNQFQFIRNTTQSPLLYFNISASSPCLNSNIQPQFKSQSYYPLSNSPQIGCDKYGNYQNISLLIDKISVSELIEQNLEIQTTLPYFNNYINSKDEYELRILRRFQFNQKSECRLLNSDIFSNSGTKSYRIMKMIRRNNLPLLIFSLIVIVFSMISIKFHNHKYCKFITKRITMIVNLSTLVILIVSLIYSSLFLYDVLASNGLKAIDSNLDEFIENECIEVQGVLIALDEIHEYSQKIYNSNLSYVYATFVGSVIYLITQSFLFLIQYISSNTQEICNNPWSGGINYDISY